MSQALLNVAAAAARKAGNLIISYQRKLESIPVEQKARHDYVTEVDRQCEALIISEIRRRYPDHAFLGEEGGQQGEGDHLWVIDPLDGTSNYLHGIPHVAVSIALLINGQPEVGVVYDPLRDEQFAAIRGQGATLEQHRIRVSGRSTLENAVIATAFPFRKRRHLEAYQGMFGAVFEKVEDFRRAGTASLDLAYVACGRLDGFFELGLKPWDIAAGALLVREAGGVVQDIAGGERYLETGHVIAAPFKLMTGLRQAIGPHVTPALAGKHA